MDNETQKSADLEQRLAVLEKSEKGTADNVKWGVDILKWGLGIFAAVAIASAGFNSWTANRNYERDKDAFEKRIGLVTQQFAADNDKEIIGLRKQSEVSFLSLSNSFLSLSNSFQNQFLALQAANSANISNTYLLLVSNLAAATVAPMLVIASNNEFRFMALITNVNQTLSNRDVNFSNNVDTALRRVQTNVAVKLSVAVGQSLLARGNLMTQGQKQPNGETLASTASYFMQAARLLFEGHNEVNLQRCLLALDNDCIPQLLGTQSKTKLIQLVKEYELADQLKLLIADLKAGNENGRYDDAIKHLQTYLEMFEGKLPIPKP